MSEKRHGVPAIFSFFIPGLGQLVKGDILSALLMFVVGIFLACLCSIGIGFFLLPILWIWNIYDAYVSPDSQTKREMKRFANLAVILVCAFALVGCGSVTADPPADGGTGGAGAKGGVGGITTTTGTGTGGQAGVLGAGGVAGACGGADLTGDPKNCGTCGHICPPAEMNKPNDSQQTCYLGNCLVPSGDLCTTNSECITGYCAANKVAGSSLCQPKPCAHSSDCPSTTPNCDDPSAGYARCSVSSPDGSASICICSTL